MSDSDVDVQRIRVHNGYTHCTLEYSDVVKKAFRKARKIGIENGHHITKMAEIFPKKSGHISYVFRCYCGYGYSINPNGKRGHGQSAIEMIKCPDSLTAMIFYTE